MPTPFPGMDPYLERASLWPNVHTSLIIAIRDELVARLPEQYYVSVEERTYQVRPEDLALTHRPDVAVARSTLPQNSDPFLSDGVSVITVELPMPEIVHEVYLELREVATDYVVTVFEVLSPTNKQPGPGRREYEQKRLTLLGTLTHLVEIDLLRAGPPMPMSGYPGQTHYRILVSRAERRPSAELLAFNIQQPIPALRVPLRPGDAEPELSLNALLHALYDRAGYSRRVDYNGPPNPPLTGPDAIWADELLRQAGRRSMTLSE